MQTKRETFYRCTFTSPSGRQVAHVRAWDLEEARQLFKSELRAEGITERGRVEVERLGEPSEPQTALA